MLPLSMPMGSRQRDTILPSTAFGPTSIQERMPASAWLRMSSSHRTGLVIWFSMAPRMLSPSARGPPAALL